MEEQPRTHKLDGIKLKRLYAAKGWSRAKLAREMGVTPKTIQRWENGEPAFESNVVRLAIVLGVEPSELYAPQFPPRDSLNENQNGWFKAAVKYSLRGLPPI